MQDSYTTTNTIKNKKCLVQKTFCPNCPRFQKIVFIRFTESPVKLEKNGFYFVLIALFIFGIFTILP